MQKFIFICQKQILRMLWKQLGWINWKKLVLVNNYDFAIGIDGSKIVSEKLKNAIESMKLEGFEFSELNYEVVTESSI